MLHSVQSLPSICFMSAQSCSLSHPNSEKELRSKAFIFSRSVSVCVITYKMKVSYELLFTLVLISMLFVYVTNECPYNWFDCGNGKCIDKMWLCDEDNDCGNLKDEENCEGRVPPEKCLSNQFQCRKNGHCIPEAWRCDREHDCDDSSDEKDCVCGTDGFDCGNGRCIVKRWLCDKENDCHNWRDEENCANNNTSSDVWSTTPYFVMSRTLRIGDLTTESLDTAATESNPLSDESNNHIGKRTTDSPGTSLEIGTLTQVSLANLAALLLLIPLVALLVYKLYKRKKTLRTTTQTTVNNMNQEAAELQSINVERNNHPCQEQ